MFYFLTPSRSWRTLITAWKLSKGFYYIIIYIVIMYFYVSVTTRCVYSFIIITIFIIKRHEFRKYVCRLTNWFAWFCFKLNDFMSNWDFIHQKDLAMPFVFPSKRKQRNFDINFTIFFTIYKRIYGQST